MYFIVRWGVIKNEQKRQNKNNHYKKKDEGVKEEGGGGHIKLGVVMTLTYKVTNWHK